MIISDEKNFIMFCPPKVGGSSLTSRLESLDSRNNFYYQPRWNEDKFKIEELKHINYKEFLDYKDSNLLSDYFKFCFVRNPYDRVYSGFLMRCHHIKNVRHPRLVENKEYLNKMDNYLNKKNYSFNSSIEFLIEIEDIGFVPLSAYTHHNGKFMLDWVGYNEKFEDDFQFICKKLGIGDTPVINRVVRTDPKPKSNPQNMRYSDYKYLEYFDKKTIQLINEIYKNDFEYFGYQKLNPDDFPRVVIHDTNFEKFHVKK